VLYKNIKHEIKTITISSKDPTIIEAENFTHGFNVSSDRTDIGLPLGLLYDNGMSYGEVAYYLRFLESGNYRVWVTYTIAESRPVSMYLDEQLITANGLAINTGGDRRDTLQSFKEAEIFIPAGKHWLRLKFSHHLPHIDSIKISKLDY
jgi:hypothetical protein